MNKSILAGLLAGIFSTAALADTVNVGAWRVTDAHLIPAAELLAALKQDPSVAGLASASGAAPVLPDEVTQAQANADGMMLGNALVKAYRDRGYLTIEARVDPTTKTVKVVEAAATPSGSYAGYLTPGIVTRDELELAAARMTPAAKLNGEAVNIEILAVDPQTGNAEIRTSSTPATDSQKAGASLGYSSMGQRYSGPDVATLYGWANIGNGQQLDASLAHGFADFSDDSKHGRYESGAFSYRKASAYGLTSVQLAYTDYKTGGSFAPLDLNGTVSRATIEHAYLVTKALTAVGRLAYTENRQNLDLAQWTDKQSYTSLFGGLRYQAASWAADAGIEQGLAGSRDYNVVPLLGRFSDHYTAFIANAAGNLDLGHGWTLTAKAGGQTGPDDTPSSAQFVLGGPDRGRSYTTGYAATPSGAYASLSINSPVFRGVQAYAGIDGAKGKPVIGADREAKSAFVGARFAVAKAISGDIGFAKTLGRNDDPTAKETKFNLLLSASF